MAEADAPQAGADREESTCRIALNIRPAGEGDLPAIVRLQALCFPTPLPEKHLRHELLANPLAEFFVAQEAPGPEGQVPVADPTSIVAYVSVWWMVDEAHVSAIAVDPAWRRRGLACRLMHVVRAEAERRDMVALTLEVRAGNIAALRLYEGLGLQQVGRRPGYYSDSGEDALILTEQLVAKGRSSRD